MPAITVAGTITGSSCPYCQFALKEGQQAVRCDSCGSITHADCWAENGGCAVVGCAEGPVLDTAGQPPAQQPSTPSASQTIGASPPGPATYRAPAGGGPGTATIVVGFIAALAIGALIAVLALGTGGGTTGVATVTQSTATETTTATTTETATTELAQPTGTEEFVGDGYTASVPLGWRRVSDMYEGKTSGSRLKWTNPDDRNVWFLIETAPGDSMSALQSARTVSRGLDNASVSSIVLSGDSNAAVIRFTDGPDVRDDYFLNVCGTGIAVLGSAPAGYFDSWESTFRDVADSVTC